MDRKTVELILSNMDFTEKPVSVSPFSHEEGDGNYDVFRIDYPGSVYVLKRAKGMEKALYTNFFSQKCRFAPAFIGSTSFDGTDYLLLEYIPGHNLMKCTREDLILTLDAMIMMQAKYWGHQKATSALDSRENRRNYLPSSSLKNAYDAYLDDCRQIPATLCHDDLLPFNVIISTGRAIFIDWEVGGILPYTASLARLIAHTEEDDDALFFMTESDREFAINYYFDYFIKGGEVPYDSYRRSLDLAIFYEYCEWIYVGNKFADTSSERYKKYLKLANEAAKQLGF